ncbi:MAG: hypothetical protein JEZ12_07430 [Desulfobacterium sp.]|nr:hypothetical protein [Desulfobacterium sp.]
MKNYKSLKHWRWYCKYHVMGGTKLGLAGGLGLFIVFLRFDGCFDGLGFDGGMGRLNLLRSLRGGQA